MDGEDIIENPSPTNMEGMDDEIDMTGDSPAKEDMEEGGAEGGSQEEGTEGEEGAEGGSQHESQDGEAGGPTGEDEEAKAGDSSPVSSKKKKSRGTKRDAPKAEKTLDLSKEPSKSLSDEFHASVMKRPI
jgi:hypothetical protein